MSDREKLIQFIDDLGLRYFSGREIDQYFDQVRGGVRNSPPPQKLWANFVPTIRLLDDLRAELGKPIVITSSYRAPAYNRAVGGASGSLHMQFSAIDFQCRGVSPRKCYDALLAMRRARKFKGGLGLYSTFVHVDTRGSNATWGAGK